MVPTGPALRYWFSDFSGILDGLRNSCCPTQDAIATVEENEAIRMGLLRNDWLEEASVNNTTSDQFIPVLVGSERQSDRIGQIDQWDKLHASTIDVVRQVAVARTKPALELFALLKDGVLNQQAMNIALARLSGRPETDIRNLLEWSEDFSSPARVKQIAESAETIAKAIKGTADAASVKAETADLNAQAAKTKAEGAETTARKAESDAAAATTAAGEAKTGSCCSDDCGE